MKRRILYVEDEPFLGKIVKETLENLDYDVRWETDGKEVIKQFSLFTPEICILDIMLPNVDGYSLCREISHLRPGIPIIFLTARVETSDLVKGFESGGTDYIRKPFSLEELVVRINNQLHIKSGAVKKSKADNDEVTIGRYTFHPLRYELHSPKEIIKLTQRDMDVLSLLVSHMNRVIDRKDLLLTVWGDDSFFNSRNLDVYIRKLRQYFKEDDSILIQTLKGKGYLFLVPSANS
jgi:DNA-binding response OmpR family regulator